MTDMQSPGRKQQQKDQQNREQQQEKYSVRQERADPESWDISSSEVLERQNTTSVAPEFDQYARELGLVPSSLDWSSMPYHAGDGSDEVNFVNLGSTDTLPQLFDPPAVPTINNSNIPQLEANAATPEVAHQAQHAIPIPGVFIFKAGADGKFLGPSSIGTTISTCLKYSVASENTGLELKSIDHLVQGIRHVDELGLSASFASSTMKPTLPDIDFMEITMAAYTENVHLRYPFMDAGELENWRGMYNDLSQASDPIKLSRLCLLSAIGYRSMASSADINPADTEPMIRTIHEQTWCLITSALASPYMDAVEIMLLHTIYLVYCGKSGIAWITCGTVIRVAQSLGLHRPTPTHLGLRDDQCQRRARVWEVAYALDAFLSLSEGRPPATTDHPANSSSPSPLWTFKNWGSSSVDDLAAEIHVWHLQLAFIANRVSDSLNKLESGSYILEDIVMLDQELLKWRDRIPLDFQPEQENLAQGHLYTAVAWLHLQYFNLMRTVHWVSHVTSTQFESHLNQCGPRIRSSESICLVAARSVIDSMNHQAQRDSNRTVRMIGIPLSYCMAAVSVIFRNILKHPTALSARTNLEYLRAGTMHVLSNLAADGPMKHFRALFQDLQRAAENSVNA